MSDRDERRTTFRGSLNERHELLDTVADLSNDAVDEGLHPAEAVTALEDVADELRERYDV